jgi:DNA-binding transcriptional LysR family regulator
MEMHQVRYFSALAETLNFTAAARRCNVSQPALTRAIKLLEEELGGPLFNRERNRSHLTELGRSVQPLLLELLASAQAAKERALSLLGLKAARLRLALVRGVTLAGMTELIESFARAYPLTEIEFLDEAGPRVVEALRAGAVELAVASTPGGEVEDLHYYPLWEERLHVLVAADDALAERPQVSFAALAERTLIGSEFCELCSLAEERLLAAGIAARPRILVDRPEWVDELVRRRLGVALLAGPRAVGEGLALRPVDDATTTRRVFLMTKRGRPYSPAVKAFVELGLTPRRRPQPALPSAA